MSIRARITALATAAVLAVLLVAGFGILRVHERQLIDAVDERLEQAADGYPPGEVVMGLSPPADDDSVAQLVRDGRVVDATSSELTEPVADPPPEREERTIREVAEVLPDEGAYRVLSVTLDTDLVLHLGANLDDVHESTSALRRVLVLSAPLVALVLGALIWWVVGRALRPVEGIRAQVGSIGGGDLHRRVPVPAADDEISRLARTMNDMLDRLERSADQQRRFVADASHELRSPLARMRAELEVDLAHPDGADLRATHHSALEEVVGLQHLVDDLLDMARLDDGTPALLAREAVDLDDLVQRAARRARADGRVTLDTTRVGAAQVQGDRDLLGRLVSNLLDNAVRHAASTVTVALHEHGGAELVVADDGPGILEADRARVFEPFTRLDEARTTGAGGAGLGLAIVHEVVLAHGGTVTIDDAPGGGARFVVRLPASGPSAGTGP